MTRDAASERPVDLLLLAVAAVWGCSYLAAKVLVVATGVLAGLALRYLLSAASMGLVVAVRRSQWSRDAVAVGLLLGGTQAAVLACETYGVAHTSATHAGLLIGLCLLLTPVLHGLISRRWLPPAFFAAALTALAGTSLLLGGPGQQGISTGDLLVRAAAVLRAVHVTASAVLTEGRECDSAVLTLLQLVAGAVLFTAVAAPAAIDSLGRLGTAQWAAAAYLGLGCSAFAFLVQLWAVRRTSPARASLLMGTEPIWAVLAGVGLGGDSLGASGAAGAVLVAAGTSWGQRVETRHRAGPVRRGFTTITELGEVTP